MKSRRRLLFVFISFLFLALIGFLYYQRGVSFSFVDEYDNIVAAHFMLQGKELFTDIFHNRQLGMVYISYSLQSLFKPDSLYQLILYHRLFVVLFSSAAALLFTVRFGFVGMITVFFYEIIKFPLFGSLFQGESLIVYPVLYLFGLAWLSLQNKKLHVIDVILAGITSWFILFTRETFIPLTFFLLAVILFYMKDKKRRFLPLGILTGLSVITLLTVPIKDFLFHLGYVNSRVNLFQGEVNFFKSFFYPLYFFIGGEQTNTRIIFTLVVLAFLIIYVYRSFLLKKWKEGLFVAVSLGLAALRPVKPGTELFAAYKMLVWDALVIFITLLLIFGISERSRRRTIRIITGGLLLCAFLYGFSTSKFVWQRVHRDREFNIAYNQFFVNGEVIRSLSQPGDTLFVDGYDSLLFWQAQLPSSYRYTLFYPISQTIPRFADERIRMFRTTPPDFYFRDCISKNNLRLPGFIKNQYVNFSSYGKPTCLYMRKENVEKLSEERRRSIERFEYRID